MDYEEGSSVSWEWEGLWGSSASLLSGADTPSPSFRAPLGGSGQTYDYVASMTTTSSGVPRTARRRVSVTVVEGEGEVGSLSSLPTGGSTPTITCADIEAHPTVGAFKMDCSATNEPAGAAYGWTETGGPKNSLTPQNVLSPFFVGWKYNHHSVIPDGGIAHEFKASMLDSLGAEIASDTVTVTILEHPDLMTCVTEYEAYAGDPDIQLECDNKGNQGRWAIAPFYAIA